MLSAAMTRVFGASPTFLAYLRSENTPIPVNEAKRLVRMSRYFANRIPKSNGTLRAANLAIGPLRFRALAQSPSR